MTIDLDAITLAHGSHTDRDDGTCLMEAVAWFAGEPHTDRPACASKILTSFGISLNDQWDPDQRQKLKPFIPRIVGTRDGQDGKRGYLALDWLIRVYTPAFLDLAKLTGDATALRNLTPILTMDAAAAAGPVVRTAQANATAAWAAAWDAAWDAARAAAGGAAWAAAGAAARDAAWAAARAAARDAAAPLARDAAWDAARDAAWDAARDAAWDAARAAARDAAGGAAWAAAWAAAGAAARAAARDAAAAHARDAAWDAARDAAWAAARDAARGAAWAAARGAARDALKPTVEQLQSSALELLDRMITIGGNV